MTQQRKRQERARVLEARAGVWVSQGRMLREVPRKTVYRFYRARRPAVLASVEGGVALSAVIFFVEGE